MDEQPTLRVERHGGNWVVREVDLDPPLRTFPTREEAERYAREQAGPRGRRVEVDDDEPGWAPEEAPTGGRGRPPSVDPPDS